VIWLHSDIAVIWDCVCRGHGKEDCHADHAP
jgi:hypothetical protein